MDERAYNEVRPGRGFSLSEENPDRIKSNIDRTRAHLDETITELSHRLAPSRLMHEFVDTFTGRKEGESIAETEAGQVAQTIRDHPVPAALISAGIAWFYMSRTRSSKPRVYNEDVSHEHREIGSHGARGWLAPGAEYEPSRSQSGGMREKAGQAASQFSHKAGEKAGDIRHKAGERASEALESGREHLSEAGGAVRNWAHKAGEAISDTAHGARERLSHTASSARERLQGHGDGHHIRERLGEKTHEMRDRLGETASNMRHRAGDTARNVRHVVEEHPLLIGAAALTVGLIAGLTAPSTRTERKLMGPMRDNLMDEAQRTMKEDVLPQAREIGKDIAREVGAATADKASEELNDADKSFGKASSDVAGAGIHRAGETLLGRMQDQKESGQQSSSKQSGQQSGQQTPGQQKPGQQNLGSQKSGPQNPGPQNPGQSRLK